MVEVKSASAWEGEVDVEATQQLAEKVPQQGFDDTVGAIERSSSVSSSGTTTGACVQSCECSN